MKLLLCLLPVFAHAQITVNIQASKATRNTVTQATGVSENIITTDDAKVFNITDEVLKKAVLVLAKKTPTNVYVRGPTPWSDLYRTYGWQPVKTVVKPNKLRVINIETSDVVLKKREVRNDETVEKNQEFTMTANVENKVSSSWERNDIFAANITYNIDVIGLGKVPKFELDSSFGHNVNENKIVTVKSASVKFDLKPKAAAIATFTATKVKVSVEVEYWVMLQGFLVTNNEVKLNGHHFWAYDIKKVMDAAQLLHSLKEKEIITVEFYADDRIVVS